MDNNVLLYDVREDIKEIYEKWVDEYNSIVKKSFSNAVSNLNPGERAPKAGVIHGDVYRESFRQATISYKATLKEILDKEERRIRDNLTEAPSEEATRAVNMFLLGIPQIDLDKNLAEKEKFLDEVDALMTRYPNYLTYNTLVNCVKNAGLINEFKIPEAMKEYALINKLRDIVNRTFVEWPVPEISEGAKALFNSTIDNADSDRPSLFA